MSLALAVGPVSAAKWDITPTLSAEETYTDNIRLAQDATKRSDWVTVLTPGISVAGTGPRLRFTGTYGAQAVYRANEGTQDLNHLLNALASAELAQQLFFLDARASISQQNISVLGPQASSNISSTTNRTNVGVFSVSPYLKRDIGADMRAEARLTYDIVDAGRNNSQDSAATRVDARLTSGPAYKLLTWHVSYSKERIDYDNGRETTLEEINAGIRRLITPNIALIANLGYEDKSYLTSSGPAKGESWAVGAAWTPTPRTNISGTVGKRYYGDSYHFEAAHRMRLVNFNASYTEEVTSTRGQLAANRNVGVAELLDPLFAAKFPDPVQRQQAVQAYMAANALPPTLLVPTDFFTNQFFLSKTFRASAGYTGVRNTVVANFFMTDRESQQSGIAVAGAGDFVNSSTVRQTGASATWSLRVSQRDAANVSLARTRNETPGINREDNVTYLRMGYTHQFEPKLSGGLAFRRTHSESNQGGTGTYTENAVTASLRMEF